MSKVMQPGEYFDQVYFGHLEGERKSNYPAVGGYKHNTGAPEGFAEWVLINLKAQYPDLKVVPPAPGMGIVGKAPKVLEIGCATGAAVQAMRKHGIRAYGCDISEYILSLAVEEMKNFLVVGDMLNLGESRVVKWAPFDVIVSKDVLEHATPDRIDEILMGLALFTPVQFHIVNTGEFDYQAFDGDKTHNIRMTLEEWEAKGRALNLNIVFKRT